MPETSMATRYEIIQNNAERYQKSSKKKKGEILDMVCESAGLSRDRAGLFILWSR